MQYTAVPRNPVLRRMGVTHLLSRAVIRKEGHLLVVQADGQPHTFLPGGHVEEGEGVESCLRRELREELGVESRVESYLGAVEHRWQQDDMAQYELNHCFAVSVPAFSAGAQPTARESYLTFAWVETDHLDSVGLQPTPLRRLISKQDPTLPWWASTLSGNGMEAGGSTEGGDAGPRRAPNPVD